MNKKQLTVVLAIVPFFFLTGCATVGVSKKNLGTLRFGQSKNKIMAKLGKPKHIFHGDCQVTGREGKIIKIKIPFEIWEYYTSRRKNSTLLYIYKGQLKQIEDLSGHLVTAKKGNIIWNKIPPIKFNIDVKDLAKSKK